MVKRLERKCCANCIFLDKGKVEKCKKTNFYRYGCNNNISEYIIGYIQRICNLKQWGVVIAIKYKQDSCLGSLPKVETNMFANIAAE